MAKKGQSRHLKRYAASRALKLPKKTHTWVVKPSPGPHSADKSIPLRVFLRDYLHVARTAKEADYILTQRQVCVDGRVRTAPSFPIGLMDVVQLKALGSFRILMNNRGNLVPKEISTEEAGFKLCQVVGKRNIKGGGFQLSFHDGTTVAGEFKEIKPLDVSKLQLPELKIVDKIPFKKGTIAFITGGSNTARVGKIVEIKEIKRGPNIVTLEADGKTFNAPANYVFGVGREKPIISI